MSFRLPLSALEVLYALVGSAYFTWAPPQGTSVPFIPANISDMVFTPAHTVLRVIGFQPSMTQVLRVLVAIHCLESLYTWYLCRRYVKGPAIKVSSRFPFTIPI